MHLCFKDCFLAYVNSYPHIPIFSKIAIHDLSTTGQFWHLEFTKQKFTDLFRNGQTRDNAVEVTTPQELGPRSFVTLTHPITWDQRSELCLYAGSRQAGASNYVTSPADPVIEGYYTDYKVEGKFGSEYEYSVFSSSDFDCPNLETTG